jgi:hypothetical protein
MAAVLAATTVACSGQDGPTGPQGPAGPSGSGSTPVFVTVNGTGSLVATDEVLTYTQLPGLSVSLTVPTGASYKLLIETDGGIQLNSAEPDAACFIDVAVFVDGAQLGPGRRVPVLNNATIVYSVSTYGFSVQTSLAAGSHTVAVMAKTFPSRVTPCYVSASANGSGLPGNPRLQGILNIIAFS